MIEPLIGILEYWNNGRMGLILAQYSNVSSLHLSKDISRLFRNFQKVSSLQIVDVKGAYRIPFLFSTTQELSVGI